MDDELKKLWQAVYTREVRDAMKNPRGWSEDLNPASERYRCQKCGKTMRDGEPVLLWLDEWTHQSCIEKMFEGRPVMVPWRTGGHECPECEEIDSIEIYRHPPVAGPRQGYCSRCDLEWRIEPLESGHITPGELPGTLLWWPPEKD